MATSINCGFRIADCEFEKQQKKKRPDVRAWSFSFASSQSAIRNPKSAM